MTEHWVWLTRCPGIGPVRQRRLLELFGSAEKIWEASDKELARAGVSPAVRAGLANRSLGPATDILKECRRAGIQVLSVPDSGYPSALSSLPDGPTVLYLQGKLPDLEYSPSIALVGARNANQRGLDTARLLGWQIAGCGGVVVTGMAKGIDAAAAGGALERGGTVIGVLGCGADVIYPRENAALFAQVQQHGCLVSEYPPGFQPNSRYFPARNRIISALSDGVAVIQASGRSGALITARWAADQGRDVFAVPGPVGEDLSVGCNRLLKDGAILAECGWDILCEYEYRYPGTVREYHGRPPAEKLLSGGQTSEAGRRGPTPQGRDASEPAKAAVDLSGLSPVQCSIVSCLSAGPVQLDALIDTLQLPAAQILPQLTVLQMKRIVLCLPGKFYKLA